MRKSLLSTICVPLALSALLLPTVITLGGTKWAADGVGIRTASANDALDPQIISDGSGGAIIAWEDDRAAAGQHGVYARRVDAAGIPLWSADGVMVCGVPHTASALNPQIASDGSGGAIITWQDYRDGHNDIYAQRLDADGNRQWADAGVGVRTTSPGNGALPQIASDLAGGAIITWQDDRGGGIYVDIYAQRVNGSGVCQWAAEGVGIRNISSAQARYPQIVSDGSGGAVITWQDNRAGDSYYDIYAQRVNASGACQWAADGAAIRDFSANSAVSPRLASDGDNGAIITWTDNRDGFNDIYAQRVTSAGIRPWTADGVGIRNSSSGSSASPRIAADGAGGAVISWVDQRSGSKWDVYAQRVDAGGSRLWTDDGVGVRTTSTGDTNQLCIVSDGAGGAIVSWQDYRAGKYDIYAQRIDAGGSPSWAAEGMSIRTAPTSTDDAAMPQMMAQGANQAIIAWQDHRAGKYDIYTQRIDASAQTWYLAEGCTSGGFETFVLVQNPNAAPVTVDLTLMTESGPQNPPALQGVTVNANSRSTFNIGTYVQTSNVSTRVEATGGEVVCERAMYGGNRNWGTDSIGATSPAPTWYLAEGCTSADFETFVLVQNPNGAPVTANLTLMTEAGPQSPPDLQGVIINANSRSTFNIGSYAQASNVSTRVDSFGGEVVCERAMYGGGRTWGTDSVGATSPAPTWYLAEGCTTGGFETFVLVQNPNTGAVTVDLTLMTEGGPQSPPALQGVPVNGNSRRTFNVGDFVQTSNVSTKVVSHGGNVVCERAMYGGGRTWGTDSIGATLPADTWLLAEGCTSGDFETFVLVQNPNAAPVTVDLTLMTESGPQSPPALQGVTVNGNSRRTFNVGEYVQTSNVSTKVVSHAGDVVCERAMYGGGRTWGTDSIGYAP